MIETLALILVGAAFGAALLFHAKESAAWRAERADLIEGARAERLALIEAARAERKDLENRVMAKNYTDYVYAANVTETRPDNGPLSPEPPDKAWHDQNFKDHPEQYPDGVEVYD